MCHNLNKTVISGEVSGITVESWKECLMDIWFIDETGCVWKGMPSWREKKVRQK